MLIKDVCVLDVACCARQTTVLAAAKTMRSQHAGDLIVVENLEQDRTPVGILTDRDIVVEVVAQGLDPAVTQVEQVMSKHLVVANASETLETALERMHTHGVRRIPVVDDEEALVGVVTLDDLLKVHTEQAARMLEVITREQQREKRGRR
jgi:CBS domain-containing protein